MRFAFAALLAQLALGSLTLGCNVGSQKGVAMQDTLALDLFGPPSDAINSPYVAGAHFNIDVVADGYDTKGWKLTSSDPTVVQVGTPTSNTSPDAPVTAIRPGHAVLSVVDAGGNVVHSHDVDVDEPDRVELHSHGLMLAGLPDGQSQLSRLDVVNGGRATLLVRYFKGSQELWGNGAVTPSVTGAIAANTARSSFGDERDWIQVSANELGDAQVTLTVGGSALAVVPVKVVDPTEIANVQLLAQSDSNAKDGDSLYVFARASNAQSEDVYGAFFGWQINDGVSSPTPVGDGSPTDLFLYQYTSKQTETVSAGIDGHASSVTVHGKGGSIASTAAVDCSVARAPGAAAGSSAFALAMGAVVTVTVRRRRRPTAAR